MHQTSEQRPDETAWARVLPAVLVGLVLTAEIVSPLGFAHGSLYVLPIALAAMARSASVLYSTLALTVPATMLGYFLSPEGLDAGWVLGNRLVSILIQGALVASLLATQRAERRAQAFAREAADVHGALEVFERTGRAGRWIHEPDRADFQLSGRAGVLLGTRRERLGRSAFLERIPPNQRVELEAAIARCVRDGVPFDLAHPLELEDGTRRAVRHLGHRAGAAGDRRVIGLLLDETETVRLRERLEEVEIVSRFAHKAARLGGWRYLNETGDLLWTTGTYRIYGVPEGTPIDLTTALDRFEAHDRERLSRALADCLRDGRAYDLVLKFESPEGERLTVRALGEPIVERGRIVGAQGAFQDISELMAARSLMEARRAGLMEVLEAIDDGFLVLDEAWRVIFVNPTAERLFGRSAEEMIDNELWTLFPEARGTTFEHEYRRAVELRESRAFIEYFHPLRRWFEVNAHPTPDGLAVYFRDVSDRKRMESELAEQSHRFRLLAEVTSDYIWEWDVLRDRWHRDPALLAHLGRPAAPSEQRLGDVVATIQEEDREPTLASLRDAVRGDADRWSGQFRFVAEDGRVIHVISKAGILRDGHGRATRVIGGITDISELRQLGDQLAVSRRLESVGQLTGGVAHDFNNLLTIILGNAELLELTSEDDGVRELAGSIHEAGSRGADLTSALLSFARQQPLEPEPIDVNGLIGASAELFRRGIPENVELHYALEAESATANADRSHLQSAILNLLINAAHAIEAQGRGRVTVETRTAVLREQDKLWAPDIVPGPYVSIAVTDDGCGMTPEIRERVFEPFFSTKEEGRGSGLGLSSVFGFVKQSGGHVRLESEPGEGTVVTLYLPLSDAGAADLERAPDEAPRGRGEHVLLVEDDEALREHVTRMLERLGYRVTAAADARSALARLDQHPDVDLLFTDVVMPGDMNGRELGDAAVTRRPGLRVLYTSGYTRDAVIHDGRLDEGVQLLGKPFRSGELARRLREILDD